MVQKVHWSWISKTLFFINVAFGASSVWAQENERIRMSKVEEFQEDFVDVPCRNKERLDGVIKLFEKMGAAPSEITIEQFKKIKNLVVRIQGSSEETIVIGAHYDKTPFGCGAIDNWSGVVIMAHIYRSLRTASLNKTLLFVAFDREERGLLGSKAMVKRIRKDEIGNYCAMINLDSFGLGQPQVLENISSEKLTAQAAKIAKLLKMPYSSAELRLGSSDSASFLKRKIPAVAIHGLAGDPSKVLHTRNDKEEIVKPVSVYLGYRLALELAVEVHNSACDAFR